MTAIKPHKAAREAAEAIRDDGTIAYHGSMVVDEGECAAIITEAYAPLVEAAKGAVNAVQAGGLDPEDVRSIILENALRAIVGD